jgi:glucose-1-phosphate thymidylyltransferase
MIMPWSNSRRGIKQIMVITGPEHMGAIVQLLGSERFCCQFTYRVQDKPAASRELGLCEALSPATTAA